MAWIKEFFKQGIDRLKNAYDKNVNVVINEMNKGLGDIDLFGNQPNQTSRKSYV